MANCCIQENHNQDFIQAIAALKKVLHDNDQGANLLHGITHLMHLNFKPLAQDLGFIPLVTSVETFSIPLPSLHTYNPPLVTTMVPSLCMSVPLVSLLTSQPSYHNVHFTYFNPLPTVVPSVPSVVSSILY